MTRKWWNTLAWNSFTINFSSIRLPRARMGTCCNGRYSDSHPIMQTPSRKNVSELIFACAEGCSQQRDCSGLSPDYLFHSICIEPIAAAKIRLFIQEVELLYRKLQYKQGSNRWEKAVKLTALSLKGNALNNECNKCNEWSKQNKERQRSLNCQQCKFVSFVRMQAFLCCFDKEKIIVNILWILLMKNSLHI